MARVCSRLTFTLPRSMACAAGNSLQTSCLDLTLKTCHAPEFGPRCAGLAPAFLLIETQEEWLETIRIKARNPPCPAPGRAAWAPDRPCLLYTSPSPRDGL